MFEQRDPAQPEQPRERYGPNKWMRSEAFWQKMYEDVFANVASAAVIAYIATVIAYWAGAELPREFKLGVGLFSALFAAFFIRDLYRALRVRPPWSVLWRTYLLLGIPSAILAGVALRFAGPILLEFITSPVT